MVAEEVKIVLFNLLVPYRQFINMCVHVGVSLWWPDGFNNSDKGMLVRTRLTVPFVVRISTHHGSYRPSSLRAGCGCHRQWLAGRGNKFRRFEGEGG